MKITAATMNVLGLLMLFLGSSQGQRIRGSLKGTQQKLPQQQHTSQPEQQQPEINAQRKLANTDTDHGEEETETAATAAPSMAPSVSLAPSQAPTNRPTRSHSSVELMLIQNNYTVWGGIEFYTAEDSYWNKALQFVEATDDSNSFPDWRTAQRYALACIFYSTNGVSTDYTNSLFSAAMHGFTFDWLHTWQLTNPAHQDDECSWYGVVCNANNEVTELNLKANWLTGSFPAETKILASSLEVLDLEFNLLSNRDTEQLWWIAYLNNLRVFNIGKTGFEFDEGLPVELKNLTKLTDLVIYSTFFSGPIDDSVFDDMESLVYLDMGALDLEGPLPASLQTLSNLTYAYLDYAGFSGNLTEFIGDGTGFESIKELWMDSNDIDGPIPTEIGGLTSLQSLSITECDLEGSIPTEIGSLSNMKQMWLYDNQLTGDFPTEIGGLLDLKIFKAHSNDLGGTMPIEICTRRYYNVLDDLTADCDNGEVTCAHTNANDCCSCCGPNC
mmetsp:Transcript_20561/g.43084  ORF Transcript_20561/g.43084 Transcript_20561/m.43084 type:complete len:499 (-) Transcript_20561:158-1654(-)|eukprot:CAMPEP_0172439650 /NCGR_PEP_ID=MMETSP1065-20121228/564_1 /TAXON_ID=265537 /ORGANISM="Amphiprora paludosa, Strain CCMP125" /LENGTH=498 /DNA_ID=CAMNT_0013188359 /DNA_START=144 /DNA_END=1640 /DNA_ORIENTATION=+